MLRYQRLQINPAKLENYDFYISEVLDRLPNIGYWISRDNTKTKHGTLDRGVCLEAACIKHLELEVPSLSSNISCYIDKCLYSVIEYFYGTWRSDYCPYPATVYHKEDCRKKLPWEDEFQEGIICALWANDNKSLIKIAEWVNEDLIDYGIYDCSESDAWFSVLFGKFIRGENLQQNQYIIEMIRKKNRRRPKFLLDILETIEQESPKFKDAITKYVKFFIKNETNLELIFKGYVSIAASMLWETAKYRGIDMPDLPEEIMDRIITRESIGLIN